MRQRVEPLLAESYAFMDSPIFKQREIGKQLFDLDSEPQLPPVAWYQPTRDEAVDQTMAAAPQLMKAAEERLMFLRFNYSKMRLCRLQKRIQRDGLTRETAEQFLEWHRRFEHFREYLVRTNLALVLAMAKRTRLGDVDFAEVVSEGNMALIRAVDKFNVDRGLQVQHVRVPGDPQGVQPHGAEVATGTRRGSRSSSSRTWRRATGPTARRDAVEEDCIDELKAIVDRNLADLSDVEETVIRRRFNWQQDEDQPADAGRGRPDHRRDQGAGPPDPEQGAGEDPPGDGGRRPPHPRQADRRADRRPGRTTGNLRRQRVTARTRAELPDRLKHGTRWSDPPGAFFARWDSSWLSAGDHRSRQPQAASRRCRAPESRGRRGNGFRLARRGARLLTQPAS